MNKTMVQVARLDHDRVYWGLEPRALAELKTGELVFCPRELDAQLPDTVRWVDAECDLPAGAYVWNPEHGRFEALPTAQRKSAPEAPTLEQAFYDLLTVGSGSPRVQAWLAWMKQSMDEKNKAAT